MKRAIGLIFLFIACIAGFLTIKGTLPFMPIFGHSMEPTFHSGSLLMIKPVNPGDVKVGDIIVYNVPTMVQDYYNYPQVVSRRVIEITTLPALGFRTKGDNTGEDPFTIRPMDILGAVGSQIPFLGLPLLFFQSQQGLIFVAIALVLLTIFLYGGELLHGGNLLYRGIFSPVINEEKRVNRVLIRKIDTTGQNRVLTALAETMGKTSTKKEKIAARIEPRAAEKQTSWIKKTVKEIKTPPRPQKAIEEMVKPVNAALNRPVPPGCARKQPRPAKEALENRKEILTTFYRFQDKQELTREALAAEQEIFSALDRLHSKLDKYKGQA
jgi:signal peptidase